METSNRTQHHVDRVASGQLAPSQDAGGAAIHPRFLRSGPWALSSVVALLFGLSFATSYAALFDYALELEFSREFAIAFPLVLDAVIIVLAVTLLLERALGRRTMTVLGWRFAVRLPSWPLACLWLYFSGSVAGNVGHVPRLLAAQLVAAVPPVSAALTFHLLLRLLDRAPALRAIAETYEERSVEEQERAAARRARRARIKTGMSSQADRKTTAAPPSAVSKSGNGHTGTPMEDWHQSNGHDVDASRGRTASATSERTERATGRDELRRRVRAAIDNGEPVTGETVGQWLGLSARTGRRRLAELLNTDPELAWAVNQNLTR